LTDYQSELAKSEATLKAIVEKEMTRDQKDFDNANNNFNQTLEDFAEKQNKLQEMYQREDNFEILIKDLKSKFGVDIIEDRKLDFKTHMKSFQINYTKLIKKAMEMERKSSKITKEFNEIIESYNIVLVMQSLLVALTSGEGGFKSKIWKLFKFDYSKEVR